MPDILVSEDVGGPALSALGGRYEVVVEPELWRRPDALARRIRGCRALIVRNQTQVTSGLLAAAEDLEVVGRAGAGLDNVDVEAATAVDVRVCYAPEQNALSVAELGMGMLLALARRLVPADRSTRAGYWDRQEHTGIELHGRTLGVIGFGRIGFLMAMRARAFGMTVLAHDPFLGPDHVTLVAAGAELVGLEELLGRADAVTCHLPSTPGTRGLLNAERFGRMKSGALFLNLSRGDVVEEAALIEALEAGQIGGAGLDVRAAEPPAASPLDRLDNVILTPHIGAFTEEAQHRVVAAVCRDIRRVLEGEQPMYAANRPRGSAR
ncbi:MAG: hydroxyacid dehydrogenase [Longimicrobiales bacterium]|nr:hydroxyacid dehydrogenase [Longimicrobiales bacterium]